MKKIIVRMPNWVGDFVMALPVLTDLRKHFASHHIAVLCSDSLTDLLEGNPNVDQVIGFSRKRRFFPKGVISFLIREKFDMGLLLTNSFSSKWLFFAGGVKKVLHFSRVKKKGEHLVVSYKRVLKPIGIDISETKPLLYPTKKEKKLGIIRIGINPGAAYGSAKCWLPDRFREVARRLVQEIPGCEVVFFGDKTTKPLIDEITKGLPISVENLAGKTSLLELRDEIGRLDVFLTNDSGPMHMAAAMKVPLVALFGSTNESVTGPYQWGEVINKKVDCAPCYKRVCPIDFRCMKKIEVDEVVHAVKRALLVNIRQKLVKPFLFESVSVPSVIEKPIATGTLPKTGCLILAAGVGRRLGLAYPKGCLEVKGKSLFERALEKAKGRVAIMTSPMVHEATKAFLKEKGYFDIPLFLSRTLPRETSEYSESPEGNGAIFESFVRSPIWEEWQDLDYLSVVPIDNPLANGFDPDMIFGCKELRVKAVKKKSPDEKMGVLVEKDKKLFVIEYSELSKEKSLLYDLAYSGVFTCSRDFFKRAAYFERPWHVVEKQDGKHYEKFVFDAFPLAIDYDVLLADRDKAFAPVKTIDDIAIVEKLLYD